MKNKFFPLLIFFFVFTAQTTFSQFRFLDGYYIDKDGKRVETRLENKRWTTWSNDFLLVSDGGKTERIPLQEIGEFGIDDKLKFITATVEIEKSSDNVEDMKEKLPPDFVTEEVLLKVLVEGKYSLFVYVGDNVRKFFYRIDNGEITQLVRRRYKEENEKIIVMEDNIFRKQLEEIKNCPGLDHSLVNYEAYSLQKFFLGVNECAASDVEFARRSLVNNRFGLNVSAGMVFSDVHINRSYYEFPLNASAPTAALNLAYKIPLLRNEVGIKLSGIYNSIETESVEDFPNSFTDRDITFSLSEIIIGASGEYIFYTGDNSAIFGGVGYYFPFLLEDTKYTETISSLNLTSKTSNPFPGIYVGYQISWFDIKFQYFLRNYNVLPGYDRFEANIDQLFFSLGYSFF